MGDWGHWRQMRMSSVLWWPVPLSQDHEATGQPLPSSRWDLTVQSCTCRLKSRLLSLHCLSVPDSWGGAYRCLRHSADTFHQPIDINFTSYIHTCIGYLPAYVPLKHLQELMIPHLLGYDEYKAAFNSSKMTLLHRAGNKNLLVIQLF